ncbi:MAG: hypothetical protein JXQ23_06775 [Clostridia bacterium]|nr:hypothetical protein [Clostridia bacterium]
MSNQYLKQQEVRRKVFNDNYIMKMMDVISDDAVFRGESPETGAREMTWHCIALLREGYYEKANSILRNLRTVKCHFLPMNFTQILYKYGNVLDDDVKNKLTEYIMAHTAFAKADRIHISMYNDNFANMAIYTCLVAGEMFHDQDLFNAGYKKLLEVEELFTRCGVLMEYGSPTYTPIDTLCFAEMANHIKDEKARELALKCEKRMLIEIATHYHPETSLLAGPYSRAYAIDMIGHPHLLSGLLWLLLGDDVFINPIRYLFKPLEKQMMHCGLERLTLPNIAWIIDTDYHIDEKLVSLSLHKKYPYHVECLTECIPSNANDDADEDDIHEYGGYKGTNTTYMTANYSLGTCQSQFHGGALSESFYITYKNKDKAKNLEDVGVIYSKYVFNDKLPEQTNHYEIFGDINETAYREEGRKFSLQKNNEALVVYKPKHYERLNVRSAKVQIMIPCHFYDGFEIQAGEKKVHQFPFTSESYETVFVKANKNYFAFKPLSYTNHGIKNAIRIDKVNNHIIISMYNYEGDSRCFGIKELLLTTAGFVVTCGEEDDYDSFEQFYDYVNQGIVDDRMEKQERAFARRVKYINGGTTLNFMYSPVTEGIYVDTIDKKPRGMSILKADGLKTEDIPFL